MNVNSWLKQAKHPDADLILLEVLSKFVFSWGRPQVTTEDERATPVTTGCRDAYPKKSEFDKTFLVSHENLELTDEQLELADKWLQRRKQGEPLAYITGYKEFYGRDFRVTPDVLIPRPETEVIVDLAKELDPREIIEVGTGSGCIAISLALELPESHIEATDISEEALEVAEANRQAFQIDPDRLELHKSDLLADISTPVADVVVANLPYVDENWDWLDKKVLDYEPAQALYAKQGGLSLVNKLIVQFTDMNIAEHLILEADPSQHRKIIDFAKKHGLKHYKTQDFILHFQRLCRHQA